MESEINELFRIQAELGKRTHDLYRALEDRDNGSFKTFVKSQIVNNGYLALSLLLQLDRKAKLELISVLVEEAVVGSARTLGIAREVLYSVGYSNALESSVIEIVKKVLINNSGDLGYQDYYLRNVAELYCALSYSGALKQFIEEFCKGSKNPDIREIYEDYK